MKIKDKKDHKVFFSHKLRHAKNKKEFFKSNITNTSFQRSNLVV